MDKASYLSLVEQGSQQKVDEAKAMAAAERAAERGLSFSLDNLSLSVNKAQLQAKGGVDLAANDKLQVNNVPQLISQLKGQLNLQAGKELVAMIPNGQQMVGSMVSAGFIKQEADGKLSVEFKLADGKTHSQWTAPATALSSWLVGANKRPCDAGRALIQAMDLIVDSARRVNVAAHV